MAKWKYLVARIAMGDLDARLNSLGTDGWELVSALPVQAYEYHTDQYGDRNWAIPMAVNVEACECVFKQEARAK